MDAPTVTRSPTPPPPTPRALHDRVIDELRRQRRTDRASARERKRRALLDGTAPRPGQRIH